ncbi:N-acetyltransferase family protein [Planctomicrobium sp. SH664]|uniref:GNAT family N-acetyltransferase n=1 Tax=Planctomicrobium sp. SH664 TaxID=3448125 RepID=UPI003F5B15ED
MSRPLDVVVRLADLNDPEQARAIVEIVNAYAQEPHGGGQRLPDEVCERMVPGIRETPGAFVLLAWDQAVVIGAAICFRGFSTFSSRPLVNVHDLSVLKAYRGQGVGTRLLEAVEEQTRSLGGTKVTLEVRLANPDAERLYRRLGYGDPSGFATRFLDKPLSEAGNRAAKPAI